MAALKVHSCLIDGEAVCCEVDGVPSFELLRNRRHDGATFVYAFDLLELDGRDLRPAPLEERRAALAKLLRQVKSGVHIRSCRGRRSHRLPARLRARRRGHRFQAQRLALSFRADGRLDQMQEPGLAGGETRS